MMDLINTLVIVSAFVIIFLLWVAVGVRHLKRLHNEIVGQWELVDEGLRKRHDLLPNLIETVRRFTDKQEERIARTVAIRREAAFEKKPSAKKIELEHDLSLVINELVDLGSDLKDLKRDTNFLELRKNIDDLEQNIEDRTGKYNNMVRHYNKHRRLVLLRPLAAVWGFSRVNIFEIEK